MAEFYDVVIKTEVKHRRNVKPDALHWNSIEKKLEYWDGEKFVNSSAEVRDVLVNSNAGEVSAASYGQIGQARKLDSSTHLDSLTIDGFYLGNTTFACTEANGYPETANLLPSVRVSTCGSMVIQHLSMAGARLYGRVSYDKGATWQSWLGMGGTKGTKLVLYVSKSGSDSASGADADHPVLTIARAIRIATAVMAGVMDSTVELRVGEGSWGNLTLKGLPFVLALKPYDGAVPTAYSASLPVYGSVTVTSSAVELTGFVANALTVQHGGNAWIATGYKRMGAVCAEYGGRVIFASANTATNLWEVTPQTVYAAGVVITTTGGLVEMYYLHIKLAGDVTVSGGFVVASRGGKLNMHRYATMFDSTAFRVTGKKCDVKTSAVVNSMEVGGTHDFFTLVLPGSGYAFEKGAIINGYTYGQVATVNGQQPDENGNVEAGGLPLGFEYFQTNPNVQAGSLPMVGGEWSRAIYADLWEWVQKQEGYLIPEAEWQEKAAANGGAVPFYSDGDGSTTFRVPALTVWCKGQGGNEAVGDYLADMFGSHKHNVTVTASGSTAEAGGHTHTRGTMNITGAVSSSPSAGALRMSTNGMSVSGAFSATVASESHAGWSSYSGQHIRSLEFDASRSWTGETSNAGSHSHTVTLNTTVSEDEQGGTETRPRTIVGLYCVVAYSTVTSSGAIDLEDVRDLLLETQEVVEEATEGAVKTVNGEEPDENGNVDVGGLPLGTAFPYTGKDVPPGTLRADGTTYTDMRAAFPEFYAWVVQSGLTKPLGSYALVEGSCGYYGLDESTGTVRMPTLAAGVFGADAASKYGLAVEAGLPGHTHTRGTMNITGSQRLSTKRWPAAAASSGTALYSSDTSTDGYLSGSSDSASGATTLNLDASRTWTGETSEPTNPIYGKSDTVTPAHVKYPWVIVVYNAATPMSMVEAAEFLTMLDGKASKEDLLNAIPAGFIMDFAGNTEPAGRWLPAWTGAAVSRTTYAELFAAIGTTYGAGDGSTTFNLPNQTDRVRQGGATAGAYKEAGLPNITGSLTGSGGEGEFARGTAGITATGALTTKHASGTWAGYESYGGYYLKQIGFDASRSNAIYGKSSTIQMAALVTRPFIKY